MAAKALPKRDEIPETDKWRTTDIYDSAEAWEQAFSWLKGQAVGVSSYQGRLGESAAVLLEFLNMSEECEKVLGKIYAYARLRKDEDSAVSETQAMSGRAQTLWVEYSQASSFFTPELLSIPGETIEGFLAQEPALGVYRHMLDDIARRRPHTLSAELEKLLAMAGEVATGASDIFGMLNDADIKFGTIEDENGEETEVTKGRYGPFLESQNRQVRKDAFDALYAAYGKQRNTLAATYNASVKSDVFYAKARKYPSALEGSVFDDNIDRAVYDNLVVSVNANLDKLHRYVRLRKRALAVEQLHFYDLYVPIVADVHVKKSFEEARAMCLAALKPLGAAYLSDLQAAFGARWIDVHENEGKRSGAYSWGVYGVHPFVLLNYQANLDDVFTLAHEMGHSMHSFYSQRTQPHVYAHYTTFLAEVASTLNEALLTRYLLEQTTDVKMRAYLLNHHLEQFRATLYRQTMFAEFERLTHQLVESGETLTADGLCDEYRKLNLRYYGPDIVLDEQIALEWARIPHFYSAFYVYQYSTGIAAATALALRILKEGEPAVARYLEFLGAGSHEYSLDILAKAGVDMRTTGPVDSALGLFGELVDELDTLIGRK